MNISYAYIHTYMCIYIHTHIYVIKHIHISFHVPLHILMYIHIDFSRKNSLYTNCSCMQQITVFTESTNSKCPIVWWRNPYFPPVHLEFVGILKIRAGFSEDFCFFVRRLFLGAWKTRAQGGLCTCRWRW